MRNPFKGVRKALSGKGALKRLTGTEDIEELKTYYELYPDEQENFKFLAFDVMKLKNPKAHYIIAFMHHNNVMARATAGHLKGKMKRKFDRAMKKNQKKVDKTVEKLAKEVKK